MPIKFHNGKEISMAEYYGFDIVTESNPEVIGFIRGFCYGLGYEYETSQNRECTHFEIQFPTAQDAAHLGCKLIYMGFAETGEFLVKQAVQKGRGR